MLEQFPKKSLSEFAECSDLRVVRDGTFSSIGYLIHSQPNMLAALYDIRFLDSVLAHQTINAVITLPSLSNKIPSHLALAISDNPLEALLRIHAYIHEKGDYWQSFETRIAPDARVHPTAYVAPNDVIIGNRVIIHPNVTILPRTIIGDDSIIHTGTVVGAEGFEPRTIKGRQQIIVHSGGVRIGKCVSIMSNTCICCNMFGGFTEIGDESIIDNLVHVAHGVVLGRRCRVVASAMLGGSTRIGDDVWIGPNATISSAIEIGHRARISLGAVVTKSVPADVHVSGNFAIEHNKLLAFLRTVR